MGRKIRIGLVGCGRVAENHILAASKCAGVEITAVAGGRRSEEMGKRIKAQVLDVEEICVSHLVDALCILTPPQFHYRYTMEAVKAGKHVLVEKPVSFSVEEIEEMKRSAAEKGVVCMPGHSYLYLPELIRMKEALKEKRLGNPTYLYLAETYHMPPELAVKYTGPETDVLCHQLYLSLAFLGKPARLTAFRTNIEGGDGQTGGPQISVMMEYDSGTVVQIFVSWAAEDHSSDPWTFKIKILGNNGSIHFSRRDFVENVGEGYEQSMYQETFDREMKWFIDECIGRGNPPLSAMEDAVWVCRLHGLVMKAIEEKEVVEVREWIK